MKAIVWTKYGPPEGLVLQEIPKPAPGDHEILIRIDATTVPSGDCEMRSLSGALWYTLPMRAYLGPKAPRSTTILGMELAGVVEATGKDVTRFQVGDPVFAATGFTHMGTYAEYICLPEDPEDGAITTQPANMTSEEAAAVPIGGLEALHFLRQGQLERGQTMLINGAGGTIGTFAIQLARHLGATVTAVDSADKLDMLHALGADDVIDYTQEDFTRRGATYDFILDLIGRSPLPNVMTALRQYGVYLIANPGLSQRLHGRWMSMTGSKKVIAGVSHPSAADLVFLKTLIEAGKLKSVIDRTYPLEAIAEAHRYVDTGRKQGNVVITVTHAPPDPS